MMFSRIGFWLMVAGAFAVAILYGVQALIDIGRRDIRASVEIANQVATERNAAGNKVTEAAGVAEVAELQKEMAERERRLAEATKKISELEKGKTQCTIDPGILRELNSLR